MTEDSDCALHIENLSVSVCWREWQCLLDSVLHIRMSMSVMWRKRLCSSNRNVSKFAIKKMTMFFKHECVNECTLKQVTKV